MTDTRTKHKDEIIERPAKAWRNWYMVIVPLVHDCDGSLGDPGDIFGSGHLWPSREIAEQKAADEDAKEIAEHGELLSKYLGAFPEGVRP